MLQVIFSEQGKILAQQSSHHFLILYFFLLRTRLHSSAAPLPLEASLLLSSTLYFCRTYSSILSAKLFQHRSISSCFIPSLHFFISSVSSSKEKYLAVSFISSVDHPFTFFVSCVRFTPLLYDMRSCTTNAGAILHDFRLQRTSFHSSLL